MKNLILSVIFSILASTVIFASGQASARLANDVQSQDLQNIAAWMNHLNYYYGDLNLSAKVPTNKAESAALMNELSQLEQYLGNGGQGLAAGDLVRVACSNPVCDGGDGGKCKMCSTGN